MNAKDVIEALKGHEDLPVFICADHGQQPYKVYSVTVANIIQEGREYTCIHDDDLENYPEAFKAIVIDG